MIEAEEQAPPGAAALDERSLAEARRLIGYDYRGARATIELTVDNVRDYCRYIDSGNPLHTDPVYAHRSRWGRALAPGTMVGTAIIAPGLPGVQWIYGGAIWRFHHPFGPGDVIAQSGQLVGADLKHGRNAPAMIVQHGRTQCRNQLGQLVLETDVTCMRIPRGRRSGGLNYAKRGVRWSEEDLAAFDQRLLAEQDRRRGAEILYWEDVRVGETMPERMCGPLRLSDIALTRGTIVRGIVGGKESDGGYGYMLDYYRRHPADSVINPETGVTEHTHRGHWEQFMAEEVGMPGIYDIGYQRLGWLCRFVTDWMGDDAVLRLLEGRLLRPVIVGDIVLISGSVTAKTEDGRALVKAAITGRNQNGEEVLAGRAEIELLARGVHDQSVH